MIFSCGETWEVKKKRLNSWHRFFVIFPRHIDDKDGKRICAALQYVERKGRITGGFMDAWWEWEYRLPK